MRVGIGQAEGSSVLDHRLKRSICDLYESLLMKLMKRNCVGL